MPANRLRAVRNLKSWPEPKQLFLCVRRHFRSRLLRHFHPLLSSGSKGVVDPGQGAKFQRFGVQNIEIGRVSCQAFSRVKKYSIFTLKTKVQKYCGMPFRPTINNDYISLLQENGFLNRFQKEFDP